MVDPPNIRTAGPQSEGSGFTKQIAGLPAWGWVAIAAAGGIAVIIWMQNRRSKGSQTDTQPPTDQDPQGLSTEQYESLLAVLRDLQGSPSTPAPAATPPHSGNPPDRTTQPPTRRPPVSNPRPTSKPNYVSVVPFNKKRPAWNSTLSGIAQHEHTSLSRLRQLNPSIRNDVIKPGQKVRVR